MNQKSTWLEISIVVAILCALSYYFYADTISLFPSYYHAWTQSDRFAIALCYLQNGMNLFKPCTFNLMTVEGITAVDLPIYEYMIAWFMKIFGSEAPWIFRTTTLLYSIIGYTFLYKLSRLIGVCTFRSLVIVVFAFTCPVLVYYQAGFVPSPFSFANVFIGYYFVFKYLKAKTKHLAWGVLFLTIAALYRTPYNIFLFAVLLQLSLKAISTKTAYRKEILYFALSYLVIIGYSIYKGFLAEKYGTMFLTELMHPSSIEEFQSLWASIWETWKYQYFTKAHYLFLGLGMLVLIWKSFTFKTWSALQKQWLIITALILAGASLYFVLMMQQFPAHDYYFIDSFYPGIIMLFALCIALIPDQKIWNISFLIISIALLYKGTLQAKAVQDMRYTRQVWDDGETTRHNFEGADVFLDSAGVAKDARILVLDAYSTNAPLILMKRWGYTVQHTTKENLQNALEDYDYDYLIVQDQYLPHAIVYNYPEIVNHLEPIAHNGKISLYKYTTDFLSQNIYDLLPIESSKRWELNLKDNLHPGWKNKFPVQQDSTLGYLIIIDGEYGPVFQQRADSLSGNTLLYEMTFTNPEPPKDFAITSNVHNGEKTIYYHSTPVRFHQMDTPKTFRCIFVLPEGLKGDETVKCHLYNPYGQKLVALNFLVSSY